MRPAHQRLALEEGGLLAADAKKLKLTDALADIEKTTEALLARNPGAPSEAAPAPEPTPENEPSP